MGMLWKIGRIASMEGRGLGIGLASMGAAMVVLLSPLSAPLEAQNTVRVTETDPLPGLFLAPRAPEPGEDASVLGAAEGPLNSVSTGVVSAILNVEGVSLRQITAPISPVSSGGPVLNFKGEVVGASVASLRSGVSVPVRDRALAESPPGQVGFSTASSLTETRRTRAIPVQEFFTPIAYGDVISDSLTPATYRIEGGKHLKVFTFHGAQGDQVQIILSSEDFNAYLVIGATTLDWWVEDYGGGRGTDAQLSVTLPASDTFYVVATTNAAGEIGDFRLSLYRYSPGTMSPPSDWVYYATTSRGIDWRYQESSLRNTFGSTWEVWTKGESEVGQMFQGHRVDDMRILIMITCADRTFLTASAHLYAGGEHISSSQASPREAPVPIVPGTQLDRLRQAICP